MKSIKYVVTIQPFAERHFIKTFEKKYKRAWELTLQAITEEFEKIDILFLKSIAEPITDKKGDVVICKTEFKISGTRDSRHASGNRCIVAMCKSTATVHVLLVYAKTDIHGSNETTKWKGLIKENYPEYRSIL